MKKTIILIATGILFTINVNANNQPLKNKIIEVGSVKNIKNYFTFPAFINETNHNQIVKVVFTVSETGNVNLAIANTNNIEIKQAIESQFLKLKLNDLKANNAYEIQFHFKTI